MYQLLSKALILGNEENLYSILTVYIEKWRSYVIIHTKVLTFQIIYIKISCC